eukprot:m.14742 g.14742  ORF g.14742 m.14742 type:complete len:101 (-) comp10339_c1_seq1:141-443(-)
MASQRQGDYQLAQTQRQVDEVVGIMRDNMEKVLERDARLGDLEDKSTTLADGASRFESNARKLKRKMWWKNTKFMLILFLVVAVLITIIVVVAVEKNKNK